MDTLPSARIAAHGRRVLLGLLSTHPPLRGCGGTFTRKRIALLGAQPQSENRSGGKVLLKSRVEGRGGRVESETEHLAPADARQPAGACDEREAQGAHAP